MAQADACAMGGGNWKGLKDFMHMEYVEKDRFTDK
jgi:hypothetical protein